MMLLAFLLYSIYFAAWKSGGEQSPSLLWGYSLFGDS